MVAELILDFLPWPGRSDRGTDLIEKVLPGRLHIRETSTPGALKEALEETGWLDGDVIAAGELRQGKEPSLLAMLTGTALIEVLRPRRSKVLPRHFVLAATRDRVVAFKALVTGDDVDQTVYELWIGPGEVSSWPREAVRLIDARTLELDGRDRVPVYRPNGDPSTDELVELLTT